MLANDDTPPSGAPFLSTLTRTATDGSGFLLTVPGEYVLVVAGSPDGPRDPTSDLVAVWPSQGSLGDDDDG